jgi:toxin ParE1/3/4
VRRAIFLTSARNDLFQIFEYIATASDSIAVAEKFVRDLRLQCHKLASFDTVMGRSRPELREDIRSFPYKGYVIFFRYDRERFEVVNIFEGHRDIDSFFNPA